MASPPSIFLRLWSLHPSYLDSKGLVAAWREALLAQAVLRGQTTGYRNHPQLERFRSQRAPLSAINFYLQGLFEESQARGFSFDRSKIGPIRKKEKIPVSDKQILFERNHLRSKVKNRAPQEAYRIPTSKRIRPHALFKVYKGKVEAWERGAT